MSVFDQAFAIVVGEEGGYGANPADPGNWTSGQAGKGECRGTKFGISAAAYPTVDIAALTLEQAQEIYRRDYWNRVGGDTLPAPLAVLVFDAAVNSGIAHAVRWLQVAAGAKPDGVMGPATLEAVKSREGKGAALLAEMLAQRLAFMASLPTWRSFGLGWSRRLCALPFHALQIKEDLP